RSRRRASRTTVLTVPRDVVAVEVVLGLFILGLVVLVVLVEVLVVGAGRPVRVRVTGRGRVLGRPRHLGVPGAGLGQQVVDVGGVLHQGVHDEGDAGRVPDTGLPAHLRPDDALGALQRGGRLGALAVRPVHRVVHGGVAQVVGDAGVRHGHEA